MRARSQEQQTVILAPRDRHLKIVAGPGAGKTRVLVSRIAHLIHTGDSPRRMAVITYTNSARDELKERIEEEVGKAGKDLFVGTIHQFCLQLAARFAAALGLSERLRVLDQAEARRMFAARISSHGWGDAKRLFDELSLERERWDGHGEVPWARSAAAEAWKSFDKTMRRMGLACFTGLQLWALEAIESVSSPPFDFVFVDEYQDTSGLQVRLLEAMARLGSFITVVGDPEQSIFHFAGADPSHLAGFPKMFTPCSSYSLKANGRSTESIVRLAGRLRDGTEQFALRVRGPRAVLWYLNSESQQAELVSREIKRLIDGRSFGAGHVAVLTREGEQLLMAAALEDKGIEYWQSRSESFEERPHVRNLIVLMDAMCFSQDEAAQLFLFEQVIKGAPKTWEALTAQLKHEDGFDGAISRVEQEVARPRRAALSQFRTIRGVFAQLAHLEPAQIVTELFAQLMEPRFGIRELRMADSIQDDIRRIADAAQQHSRLQSLSAWLRQGGLAPRPAPDCVTLGTLHFAKGREWDVVFLVDLSNGVMPHRLNPHRDEERRLLHVGASRARDLLYLASPQRLPGRGEGHSPFLKSLQTLCEVSDLRG